MAPQRFRAAFTHHDRGYCAVGVSNCQVDAPVRKLRRPGANCRF